MIYFLSLKISWLEVSIPKKSALSCQADIQPHPKKYVKYLLDVRATPGDAGESHPEGRPEEIEG